MPFAEAAAADPEVELDLASNSDDQKPLRGALGTAEAGGQDQTPKADQVADPGSQSTGHAGSCR